jgi:hypothetical protein
MEKLAASMSGIILNVHAESETILQVGPEAVKPLLLMRVLHSSPLLTRFFPSSVQIFHGERTPIGWL